MVHCSVHVSDPRHHERCTSSHLCCLLCASASCAKSDSCRRGWWDQGEILVDVVVVVGGGIHQAIDFCIAKAVCPNPPDKKSTTTNH